MAVGIANIYYGQTLLPQLAAEWKISSAQVVLSGTREAVLQEVAATLKGESAIVACNLSDPAATRARPTECAA